MVPKRPLRICYFGSYSPNYSRHQVLLTGLRQNGVEVIECNSQKYGWPRYWELLNKYYQQPRDWDLLLVGFSGYDGPKIALLAWCLTRKKIIYDAFFSVYDTFVGDRELTPPGSFAAHYTYWVEWLACRLVNLVLLDTPAHGDFFAKLFHLPRKKFVSIYIGSCPSELVYQPQPGGDGRPFQVHFHGNFIPLQGIPYIIQAAALLKTENIIFRFFGYGQTFVAVKKLVADLNLTNCQLLGFRPFREVAPAMIRADLCLGIFGATEKAANVIPNKVYEQIAAGCPTLTGDSPAARELFTDRKNILLAQMADPADLAAKILELRDQPKLRQTIAAGGRKLFQEKLTPSVLGRELVQILTTLI